MMLALDAIDDKYVVYVYDPNDMLRGSLTFTAVGSAFDRSAQQATRATRKLNNRFEHILPDFVFHLT